MVVTRRDIIEKESIYKQSSRWMQRVRYLKDDLVVWIFGAGLSQIMEMGPTEEEE